MSPFYLKQLLGRAPSVHIHLQTTIEKVSEHRRQPLRVLQLWSPIGGYKVQCLNRWMWSDRHTGKLNLKSWPVRVRYSSCRTAGGRGVLPWVDSRSGRVVLPPPSLLPWFLETRCLLLGHKPSESPPPVPSSRAFLPSCCACFALEWSGHRSQSRLRKTEQNKSGVRNI